MDKRDIGIGFIGLVGIAYVVSNGMMLADFIKGRKDKSSKGESFDAEHYCVKCGDEATIFHDSKLEDDSLLMSSVWLCDGCHQNYLSFSADETVCLMCGDYKDPKKAYCCGDCSGYANQRVNPLGGKSGGGFPRGDIAKAVLTLKEYGGEMSANQWKARIRDIRPTRKELNTNEIHKLVNYLNPDIYIKTPGKIITYQITGGNCYDEWAKERYQAESFDAELKRDSCCCGATVETPCLCMVEGVMECSASEPKCPCYAAKDAESFDAESGYCEPCGIDGQFWGDGKARTQCYKCGGVTIIDEYKDAESFAAPYPRKKGEYYNRCHECDGNIMEDQYQIETTYTRHYCVDSDRGKSTCGMDEEWEDTEESYAESFEAEEKICKDCGETYEDCDMFLNPDCERLEGVELSHEDKATRIYEGIQQNINNPKTVRFYYEMFYGEPPAEDYEGDMALDVIEAVEQNLGGEAFVDYMYGEMYNAESFEAEDKRNCVVCDKLIGYVQHNQCDECNGWMCNETCEVQTEGGYGDVFCKNCFTKDAESFGADFVPLNQEYWCSWCGDNEKSSLPQNCINYHYHYQRDNPSCGNKMCVTCYNQHEGRCYPCEEKEQAAESFEAPGEMEEEDFTPMDITQCHVCARQYEYSRIARALVQHYLKESKDGTLGWKNKSNPDGTRRTVRNIAGYQLYWFGLGALENYLEEGKISKMSPMVIELLRTAIVPNIIAGDVVQFIESMEIDDIEDTDPKFFTDFSDTWEAPDDRLKPERPSDDSGDRSKYRKKPRKPWRAENEPSE